MASLRKMRGKWYARVRIQCGHSWGEKSIALRTESKVIARKRLAKVEAYEEDIKSGIDFTFSWLNDQGKTTVKHLTVADAGN